MKFIDIDPKDIDTSRQGRRGRVSYPILKAFMERNSKVSKLDLTGLNKNPNYLRSMLQSYIRNHEMPIKVFSANGEIHLMRLDLDNDNNPIPWEPDMIASEGSEGSDRDMDAVPITEDEVASRFKDEKGKVTK